MNGEQVAAMEPRALHERLGKVGNQPIDVSSFTNKRLTINFRSPVERLRQLVPSYIEVEEIADTGMGMISMCVCDFWVTRFGALPIPKIHTNEMLCRISVRIPKRSKLHRAYYTLRSDSSSRLLAFLGGRFSHFRKANSHFTRRDDGEVYELRCQARDEICNGYFQADMRSLSKERPATTLFANIEDATDFVFRLDGSCGFSYSSAKLSFQQIEYPQWNLYFCHNWDGKFSLLDYLFKAHDLQAELDCVLFMQNVPQVWRHSWLYRPDSAQSVRQRHTTAGAV